MTGGILAGGEEREARLSRVSLCGPLFVPSGKGKEEEKRAPAHLSSGGEWGGWNTTVRLFRRKEKGRRRRVPLI